MDDMSSTTEQQLNDVTEEAAAEANSVITNEQLMIAGEDNDGSGCAESIDEIESEIQRLQSEHALLKEKLINVRFSEQWFENQDGKVEYYTGLPSFKVLQSIFGFVEAYIPAAEESGGNLQPFQQFVMTLMRLKLGLDPQDLALQFMTSVSTVLDTFEIVIHVLYMRLQCLIPEMPERDVFWKTMPDVFRKPLGFGQKIAVIVDCFEILIDTPELEEACKQSWSDTELTHTVKCLVGFTPEGCIVFVSETFVGGAPNWSILEDCGILNNMKAGDIVLAGCSRCSQCSSMFCVKVDKMFNKDGTPQLTEDGEEKSEITVIEGEARSSLQVLKPHAEKLNGYVREKFLILKKRIPLDFLSNEDGEKPILDKILTVVCGLCNLYESPTNKL